MRGRSLDGHSGRVADLVRAVTVADLTPEAAGARAALASSREYLLALQHADGWWKAELETNVTMDAEGVLLRGFLGIREPGGTERAAAWMRSAQREDGTWSVFAGGPADLSTTIEAYVALRLAGDEPQAEHMRAASAYVRAAGGVERARVFTHIWLALFGAWSWDRVPALLPEQILLPAWFPLNVYDFACWARQTVVAMSVVLALPPVRQLPFSIDELHGPQPWASPKATTPIGHAVVALDRVLQIYQRHPIKPLRRFCLRKVDRWIADRQESDGGWGGVQPPRVDSLIALHLLGYPDDHPAIVSGLAGMESFTIDEGDGLRRVEACQSPVWDTCLALIALHEASVPDDDEAVQRGARWLADEQILGRGDWAVRRPGLEPGGWAV